MNQTMTIPGHLVTLAAGGPDQHVYNHPFFSTETGWWIWSGNMGNLMLSAIILVIGGLYVAAKVRTGPASQGSSRYITGSRFAHLIEVFCVYLREEVVRPLLHDRTNKMMPMLWTMFFFILVNNLLGLIPIMDIIHVLDEKFLHLGWAADHRTPIGGTATQNIWVTASLAIVSAIFFNIAAVMRLGIGGYLKHLTGGAPIGVNVLLFILEGAGQIIIKPVALAIRLFANMTAGHILLATLFMFVAQVWGKSLVLSGPITIISALGGFAIMLLELFVAFLQAFIFMFLTTVFISLMDHHDEEHGHEHGHDHAPGHEHVAHA
ncbi:MAG: F0F1 ATP synthase subunit A [Phycisphaerales bacterium]|nr:F0F1 ATP synthase subunit A [Phycisphaerales bacterium]